MLIDHRTYTVRVGTLRKQIALYEKHGLAAQKRHQLLSAPPDAGLSACGLEPIRFPSGARAR